MVKIIVPGDPVAKGRPRVGKWGTYTPTKTVNYETLVKELFIISGQGKEDGELKALIDAYFPILKSTSKKNTKLMLEGIIRHTKKPDADNIGKICLDALNKLAFDDDSQIVDLRVRKFYSDNPRVEIEINQL
jgi:Holliday junction resolvase RusA-like endonuclease